MQTDQMSISRPQVQVRNPMWTLYLLFVIALVGAPGCTIGVPLILLGRLCRPLEIFMCRYARAAIHFMFSLNYWLKKDILLNIPRKIGRSNTPCIFVANHRSNLDVFFIISHIPCIRIMAKRTLWFVPFLGSMMWVLRQIPVSRGSVASFVKATKIAKDTLERGDPILIFPEAKRCSIGQLGTQRFNPGAFLLAAETKIPIIPLVFVNTDRVWGRGRFSIDPNHHVKFISLPPVDPKKFESAAALSSEVQRQINQCLKDHAQ